MNLIESESLTAFTAADSPGQRPYRVRYTAGFYPTGTAVSLTIGSTEIVVNPADPDVYRMLDRLSRQQEIVVFVAGRPETISHGRMARQQLQQILRRTAAHLPQCRLDWQATLNEFTRLGLVAR